MLYSVRERQYKERETQDHKEWTFMLHSKIMPQVVLLKRSQN